MVRWGSEIKALLVVDLGYSGWRKFWELGLGIEVGSIGMGEMVADRLTWRRGCVVWLWSGGLCDVHPKDRWEKKRSFDVMGNIWQSINEI